MTFGLVAPVRIDCPCGCGRYGAPRKSAWRDGLVHTKNCECSGYCLAGEQKRTAMRREDRVAAKSGGRRNPGSGARGGMDLADHVFQIEETANVAIVRGFRSWWSGKGVQDKVRYLLGREAMGPRALVLSWDDEPQMVVMPFSDWAGVTTELEQRRAAS